MEWVMMLEPLVHKLVEELEFESVPIKEGDVYSLPLNPEMTIDIHERDPGVAFFAKIGPCPKEKREELFILLMKANFLGQGTGGAVIALDESENLLTLSSVLPYDMSYNGFKEALEDFANYLDYWREELIRHKQSLDQIL